MPPAAGIVVAVIVTDAAMTGVMAVIGALARNTTG
jgi:hypothetical protein